LQECWLLDNRWLRAAYRNEVTDALPYIMTRLVWRAELGLHGVCVSWRMYKPCSQKKLTAGLDTIK